MRNAGAVPLHDAAPRWTVTSRVASQGITCSVPWAQLLIFLVVAAMVGVVAAVLPARRASRISILEAIHYE